MGPTEMGLIGIGLTTPDLFTGMQDIHGPLEWVSVQDIASATALMLKLIATAIASPPSRTAKS